MPLRGVGATGRRLDLEQKFSFMGGHYLKSESCMKINMSLYNSSTRARFWNYFLGTIIKKGNTHDVLPLKQNWLDA